MNNGPQKGNSRETWNTLKSSPGLEDIWQLHYSVQRPAAVRFEEQAGPGGPDANASEAFIANLGDVQPTHTPVYALKVSVRSDGGFTVTNTRTGFSKDYAAKSNR